MPSPVDIVPILETKPARLSDDAAKTIYQDILRTSESGSESSVIASALRESGLQFAQSISEEFAEHPIHFLYVSPDQVKRRTNTGDPTEYRQYIWIKANGPISHDKRANAIALAYASDHDLINTIVRAHADSSHIDIMVSLDHTIFFHDVRSPNIRLMK